MSPQLGAGPEAGEAFLSGAYRRILRITLALGIAGAVMAAVVSWQSILGVVTGTLVATLSFLWLHEGANLLVHRMLAQKPRFLRVRLFLSFPLRYLLVIAAAYVILKGYPGARIGFIVGLALPLLAVLCEGIYEAVVPGKSKHPQD